MIGLPLGTRHSWKIFAWHLGSQSCTVIYDALSTADRGSRNDRCGEINRPAVIIFVRFDFLERNSGAADATERTSLSLSLFCYCCCSYLCVCAYHSVSALLMIGRRWKMDGRARAKRRNFDEFQLVFRVFRLVNDVRRLS